MTPTSPLTWASRTNLADKAGLSCLRLRTLFLLEAGAELGAVIAEVRRRWCKTEEVRQQIGAGAQDLRFGDGVIRSVGAKRSDPEGLVR